MRARALDCIIDLCALIDRRVRWRWVDRLFLWAWGKAQEPVMLYDASTRKWYRCE